MATKSKKTRTVRASKQARNTRKNIRLSLRNKKLAFVLVIVFAIIGFVMIRNSSAAEWDVVWSDEFDGSSLNTANWGVYHNTYGDGNNEEACLTPNNVTVSNGTMKITAKKETITCPGKTSADAFSSGFISTRSIGSNGSNATSQGKYFPKYAKYEMRARIPHGQGLWPAFWLRHKNGSSIGEIDVMEYFHAQVPGKTTGTVHFDNVKNVGKKTVSFENATSTPGWHTWAVEVQPDPTDSTKAQISFFLNGTLYYSITPTQQSWASQVDPEAMFDIAVNMAVGGNYSGHPDDALGWSRYLNFCLKPYKGAQPCDATGIRRASFPEVMEVDYIRVYRKGTTTTNPPTDPTSTKLATPINLKVTASDQKVTLNWDSVPNANNYTVRWGSGSTWTNYSNDTGTNPTSNTYTITGLTNGTTYNFSVAARDSTGTYAGSDYSSTVTGTPTTTTTTSTVIAPPSGLKATAGKRKVSLSWVKSTDPSVDEYSVRYIRSDSTSKGDGAAWTYPGRTSGTSYAVSNLVRGVKYDFQVRAIDNKGTASTSDDTYSAYTSTVAATPR